MTTPRILSMLVVVLLALGGGAPAASAKNSGPGVPATDKVYETAFAFATAIRRDQFDRGKMQGKAVLAYAAQGYLDRSLQLADQVEGWNRGVVYAELALAVGQRGQMTEARRLLDQAREIGNKLQDWTGPRVLAHVAQTEAALGDLVAAARVAERIEEPAERAKVDVQIAAGLAAQNQVDTALKLLSANLAGAHAFDQKRSQLEGLLKIARLPALASNWSKRKEVLLAARELSRGMPFLLRVEKDAEIADLFYGMGYRADARQTLAEVETALLKEEMSTEYRAPLTATVALAWHRQGARDRARRLVGGALRGLDRTQEIYQPAAVAAAAAGYGGLGDWREARRLFGQSLDLAGTLVNPRPRAEAVVEICCQVGRVGYRLNPAEEAKLVRLLSSLATGW